jgi:hypothetical protein
MPLRAHQKEPEMNIHDLYPSKYLRASDLNGNAHTVTIAKIEVESLGDPQRPDRKPVLYFTEPVKPMVMNKTNGMSIAAKFGPELSNWVGGKLELFSMIVNGPSGQVEGIRLRPLDKAAPAAAAAQAQF